MFGTPLLKLRIGGEAGFDRLVVVKFVLHQIEGEHAPGPETAGLDDFTRKVMHQTGFGGQDEVAVVENLVARGAQAVAVEGGADGETISENHRGGAVPRLHHAGVITEKAARLGGELFIFFPGRGHHHHRGVERTAATQGDELKGVVEGGRVRHGRLNERLEVGETVAPDPVGDGVFAGAHAVAIAADGVDLAVVGHHPERMGQVPGGEGVGRVALVENRERGGEQRRFQVGEVLAQLDGREQALVNDGARGERADIKTLDFCLGDLTLDALLREEKFTLKSVVGEVFLASDEGLNDEWLGFDGLAAKAAGVGGDFAPIEPGEALSLDRGFDDFLGVGLGVFIAARQENHAHAQVLFAEKGFFALGQVGLKKFQRQLGEQAGAVAGDGIGVDGTAMGEGLEGVDGALEHVVGALAGELGDTPDTACIMFLISGIKRGRKDLGHGKRRYGRNG